MTPFFKLPHGAIFQTRTGRWRKIFPTPNTNRRGLPPWNALLIDPPTIHPNLWRQAEHDARLAIELNTLAVSPVYGTFLDGFLVTIVDEASAPALISMPAIASKDDDQPVQSTGLIAQASI